MREQSVLLMHYHPNKDTAFFMSNAQSTLNFLLRSAWESEGPCTSELPMAKLLMRASNACNMFPVVVKRSSSEHGKLNYK